MSLAPAYIPLHGSLADRVVEWFGAHPDEQLTRGDVALKFHVTQTSVPLLLNPAVADGRLEWVTTKHGQFYQLGDGEPLPPSTTPPAAALAAADLFFSISPDRCIAVSFVVPGLIDPRAVLAAMLEAAAHTIGKST